MDMMNELLSGREKLAEEIRPFGSSGDSCMEWLGKYHWKIEEFGKSLIDILDDPDFVKDAEDCEVDTHLGRAFKDIVMAADRYGDPATVEEWAAVITHSFLLWSRG